MSDARRGVTIVGSLSTGLGVLGGVAIFFPAVREWMGQNGLLGWILATIALCLLSFASGIADRAHEMDVSTVANKRKRDYDLVLDRLRGWTATGEFMDFLENQVLYSHFPVKFADQMDERLRLWDLDTRRIETQPLRDAWDAAECDVAKYAATLRNHTWFKDSGPRSESDYDYLSLPIEWKANDPDRYHAALAELRATWTPAKSSLKQLFRVLHEYQ